MKILILSLMLCNPFAPIGHAVKAVGHGIKHVTSTAFYATTNFFVDHIQPNQKGEKGFLKGGTCPGEDIVEFHYDPATGRHWGTCTSPNQKADKPSCH